MRILLSGGLKTQNIISGVSKKFTSSGDEFIVETFLDSVTSIFAKGDYFDRALITDQSITKEGEITDESEIRQRINNFALEMAAKNKRYSFVFLTQHKHMAEIIYEEILPILDDSVVIYKKPKYSVQFFVELIITDVKQMPKEWVYSAEDIVVETPETEDEQSEEEVDPMADMDVPEDTFTATAIPHDMDSDFFGKAEDIDDDKLNGLFEGTELDTDELGLPEGAEEEEEGFEGGFESTGENEQGFGEAEGFGDFGDVQDNGFENTENEENETEENEPVQDDETIETDDIQPIVQSGDMADLSEEENDTDEVPVDMGNEEYGMNNNGFGTLEGFDEPFEDEDNSEQETESEVDPSLFGDTSSLMDNNESSGFEDNSSDENTGFENNSAGFENNNDFGTQDLGSMGAAAGFMAGAATANILNTELNSGNGLIDNNENQQSNNGLLEGFDDEEETAVTENDNFNNNVNDNFNNNANDFGFNDYGYENNSTNNGAAPLVDDGDYSGDSETEFGPDDYADDMADNDEDAQEQYQNDIAEQAARTQGAFGMEDYQEQEDENSLMNQQNVQANNQRPAKKKGGLFSKVKKTVSGAVSTQHNEEEETIRPVVNKKATSSSNVNKIKEDLRPFAARGNSILVTGCGGCGTSTIAFNLANIICQLGYTVLLVDMDTEERTQNYISKLNYESMEAEGANLMVAVNSTTGISKDVSVVRTGFHLLTMGIATDTAPVEDILHKEKIARFINLAKTSYNFVIYDVPFKETVGFLSDITYMCDNLVLTVDASNWGITKTLLSMCNIDSDDMQDTMFSRAQLVFNRQRSLSRVLGTKVRSCYDIVKAMDKKVKELIGEDPGYHFEDLHIAGIINDDPVFEDGWFEQVQYSDTRKGQAIFLELADSIILKK